MEDVDLKELLQKNEELLSSLDKRLHKIEKHARTEMILNWIKWLIIVVPIVFGIIYISPYVKTYVRMLQPALEALHLNGISDLLGNNTNSAQVPEASVLEGLCDPAKMEDLVNRYCNN